jgi:alpha-1,2-mannosyltransferase
MAPALVRGQQMVAPTGRRVTLMVALWAIAVFSSGASPMLAAFSGAFLPSDFASNVAAARELAAGRDPWGPDFAAAHAAVLGVPATEGRPYFPHPPLAAVLIRPLAPVSFSTAAMIWFAVSLGELFILAVLLAEVVVDGGATEHPDPPGRVVAALYGALLVWPPVLYNLEKGQWSILLALLVALAWRAQRGGRPTLAGTWMGLASAVKVFPVLLGLFVFLRRDWRATTAFGAALAAGIIVPLAWTGPGALAGFVHHSQANLPYWETWLGVMYSFDGLVARLLVGGEWATPLVHAPVTARVVILVGSVLLLAAAGVTALLPLSRGAPAASFAAFSIALVILNPISMGHNGVLLALPIALVGRTLVASARAWPYTAWAVGTVLASVPKETIFRLCPVPVDPLRGAFLVGLPFWGALLLLVAAVATTFGARFSMAAGGDLSIRHSDRWVGHLPDEKL